jgi:hypothetical protein
LRCVLFSFLFCAAICQKVKLNKYPMHDAIGCTMHNWEVESVNTVKEYLLIPIEKCKLHFLCHCYLLCGGHFVLIIIIVSIMSVFMIFDCHVKKLLRFTWLYLVHKQARPLYSKSGTGKVKEKICLWLNDFFWADSLSV